METAEILRLKTYQSANVNLTGDPYLILADQWKIYHYYRKTPSILPSGQNAMDTPKTPVADCNPPCSAHRYAVRGNITCSQDFPRLLHPRKRTALLNENLSLYETITL